MIGFGIISGTPLNAGGCRNHINKNAKIECQKKNTKCMKIKTEKYELNNKVSS